MIWVWELSEEEYQGNRGTVLGGGGNENTGVEERPRRWGGDLVRGSSRGRGREEDGGREGARWRKRVAVGGGGPDGGKRGKGWGRGCPRRGRTKCFFFFLVGGDKQVRLTDGSKGPVRIRPWLAGLRTLDA